MVYGNFLKSEIFTDSQYSAHFFPLFFYVISLTSSRIDKAGA